MKLREYQESAADFIYGHDRSMILAPVGAGKTATALTAMYAMLIDEVVRRWLVVAPLRVCRDVWPVEAAKWTPKMRVNVAIGTPNARERAMSSPSDVVVINYDNLQWLAAQDLTGFDGIVFDELTRLKNPSGARFKALHKVIEQFNIRVGLTGSFTSNGLEDVFGQCKIIDQKLLGRSKGAFLQTYFWNMGVYGSYDDWQPRPGALQQVMDRIKPATFILENKDYKDGLPELHTVELRCDLYNREPYEKMKKHFVAELGDATAIAASAAAVTMKLQQMSGGWAYTDTGSAWYSQHKFDLLDDLIEENQHANTIIWYWFKEELAELKRRCPDAVTLDDTDAVKRWDDGKVELLLAHPMSAGHGLNLQYGGSKMVFLTPPWSLELYEQAIGRLHRNGQKHDVWVYVLLTNKTIDEQIWASLHDRRSISETALEALK